MGILAIVLLVIIGIVFVWILPIISILGSNRTQGIEKLLWLLAVIFISWFAWIFYLILAPLDRRPKYENY